LLRFRWGRGEIGPWFLSVSLLGLHLDWAPLTNHLPFGFNLMADMLLGLSMLLVVFDDRSSLGLVKLRSKQLSHELAKVFAEIEQESAAARANSSLPFNGITDEEIDSLFSPA